MSEHFFTHDAKKYRRGRNPFSAPVYVKRTLCERFFRESRGCSLRESAIVTCPKCMVVKDAWLSMPKRKPLTVRRLRVLVGASKGSWERGLTNEVRR